MNLGQPLILADKHFFVFKIFVTIETETWALNTWLKDMVTVAHCQSSLVWIH